MRLYHIIGFTTASQVSLSYLALFTIGLFLLVFVCLWLFVMAFGSRILKKVIAQYFLLLEKEYLHLTPISNPQFWLYKNHRIKHISGVLLELKEDGQTVAAKIPSGKTYTQRLSSPDDYILPKLYQKSPLKALMFNFIGMNGESWHIYIRLDRDHKALVEISKRQFIQ